MAKFPEYARDFRYTNQVNESEVFMHLSAPILRGNDQKTPYSKIIIGSIFAEEMYFWHEQGRKITVKINCPGGDVMQGFSIMDAVRQTGAKTHNAGIAASMALPIFLAGSERTAMSYASAMIHAPHYPDGSTKKDSLLECMRDSLHTILTECSDYTEEEIAAMLKDNQPDTWLNAEQMYNKKMLTSKPIPAKDKVATAASNEYELHEIFNSLIEENQMDNTELQRVQAALTQATADTAAKDARIALLEKAIADKDAADKLAKENAAKLLVENAIKEKKLVAESDVLKNQFVQMALNMPEAFNAIISAAKPAHMSVVSSLKKDSVSPTGEKTYNDYTGAELVNLMDNDPTAYNKLLNEFNSKHKI